MLSTATDQLDVPAVRLEALPQEYPWRRAFLLPWLISAGIVTGIRMLQAVELHYDLTIQIAAARELLNGKGLATFATTSSNFADPLTLVTLTHFPSGYSLMTAALLLLGATPALVVKVLGAGATMIGWWGWATIAFACIGPIFGRDARWRAIGCTLGVLTPLLYTLPWGGTDIFLWACIPWVLQLLTRSPDSTLDLRSDLVAGAIVGLAVLMRYASLFLAAFALAMILRHSGTQVARLARRLGAFMAGLAPALALQAWVVLAGTHAVAAPGGVPLNIGAASAGKVWSELPHMATANTALAFWMPRQILSFLTADTTLTWILGTAIMLGLPALVIAALARDRAPRQRRALVASAAALLPAVPLFLWACETMGARGYSSEPRYYAPLIPLAVPLVCLLASSTAWAKARIGRVGRALALCYVLAFMVVTAARVVALAGATPMAMNQRARVTGTTERGPWPSFGLTEDASTARQVVAALLKSEPDAILITNVDHWFYTDATLDLSRVHPMAACGKLAADAEVKGPARILILASDLGGPAGELFAFSERWRYRASCFEALEPFTSVRYFPDEELKLLEATVPAGTRVALRKSRD